MTLPQLQQLPNPELDRMAAEVQGWTVPHGPDVDPFADWPTDETGMEWACIPCPTEDLNQAHELETFVIGKAGLSKWITAIHQAVPPDGFGSTDTAGMIRADARTRVIACLLAVGGGE